VDGIGGMTAISVPHTVHEAIAALYGGAFRHPFQTFKEAALRSLRDLLVA